MLTDVSCESRRPLFQMKDSSAKTVANDLWGFLWLTVITRTLSLVFKGRQQWICVTPQRGQCAPSGVVTKRPRAHNAQQSRLRDQYAHTTAAKFTPEQYQVPVFRVSRWRVRSTDWSPKSHASSARRCAPVMDCLEILICAEEWHAESTLGVRYGFWRDVRCVVCELMSFGVWQTVRKFVEWMCCDSRCSLFIMKDFYAMHAILSFLVWLSSIEHRCWLHKLWK